MSEPLWSLITVSYNSAATMRTHWVGSRPDHVEWIVVDNASSDGSAEAAHQLGADKVIELPENIGFGGANNAGFVQARGKYVAFVNPDIVVDYDSLTALEEAISEHGGLCAPQLSELDGTLQPNGRSAPSLVNKVLSRLKVRRVIDRYYVYANPDEVPEVDWVIGAAVLGERDTFTRLGASGPWDTTFFVYYEDSDLALRAWDMGIPSRVVGSARWHHGWERATTSVNWRAWKLELSSMAKFYRRYPALIFGAGHGSWPSARPGRNTIETGTAR